MIKMDCEDCEWYDAKEHECFTPNGECIYENDEE